MERRELDLELKYTVPTLSEVEARVRQAHELRSEVLASGVRWVLRQVRAGLHWLVGLEWADAARNRKDELSLRYLRASSPAHLEPAAPRVPETAAAKLAVARRQTPRLPEDERARAA